MQVRELMQGDVVTADPKSSVRSVARMMVDRRVGSVIVVDGEDIVGIVTDRDILNTIARNPAFDFDTMGAANIMTRQVHWIAAEAGVEKAVDMMVQYRIKKLPVVEDGKVVGIITSTDISSDSSEVMTSFRRVLHRLKRDLPRTWRGPSSRRPPSIQREKME